MSSVTLIFNIKYYAIIYESLLHPEQLYHKNMYLNTCLLLKFPGFNRKYNTLLKYLCNMFW